MKFCETVYVFPSTQQMLSEPIDRICHSTFVPSSEFELSATPFLKHLFLSSVILLFQALPPSPEIHSFLHYCYLIFLYSPLNNGSFTGLHFSLSFLLLLQVISSINHNSICPAQYTIGAIVSYI